MNRRIKMKILKRKNERLESENKRLHECLDPYTPSFDNEHYDVVTLEAVYVHSRPVPKDMVTDILAREFSDSIGNYIELCPPEQIDGYLGEPLCKYRALLKLIAPNKSKIRKGDDIL